VTKNKTKKVNWNDLKKHLKEFSRDGIIDVLKAVYEQFDDVKAFLAARYQLLDLDAVLEPYKKEIKKWLKPKKIDQREYAPKLTFRLAEAKKPISNYKKATSDPLGTIELMLFYLEEGAYVMKRYGYDSDHYDGAYIEGKFFDSMSTVFRDLCEAIFKENNPELFDRLKEKISTVVLSFGDYDTSYKEAYNLLAQKINSSR
jgi:hypothetical protein